MATPKFGHIKLSRKLFDGAEWLDGTRFDARSAWIDLIGMAAWKPFLYRGKDQLQRGEFVASVRFLAQRWGWPSSTVADSLRIRTAAGQLAVQRTGHHGRVYLIVNYELYQGGASEAVQESAQLTVENPDSGRTKKKQLKAVSTSVSPDGDALPASNWVSRLAELWTAEVGAVSHGHLGKALKDAHARYGEADLALAIRFYAAQHRGGKKKLAWFMEQIADYTRMARQLQEAPLVDGWMSPELERLTRPTGGVAA